MKLLEAYRESPGLHTVAAKAAGVGSHFARKTWDDGWDQLRYPWALPIMHVLADEARKQEEDRKRREQELRDKEYEQLIEARAAAIEARAEEATGSKLSRKNAIACAALATQLISVMNNLINELQRRTKSCSEMSLREIEALLRLGGSYTERSVRILRMALDIERVVSGDPSAVIELRAAESFSPEEVASEITRIMSVVERGKARFRPMPAMFDGLPPATVDGEVLAAMEEEDL